VLLSLEGSGILEATREHYPAHYHVAVFPQRYRTYVAALEKRSTTRLAQATPLEKARYKVRRGDSLWTIARSHGLSVDELRAMNGLRGSRIYAGQVLEVPTGQ
jgi:LysM repeat protein